MKIAERHKYILDKLNEQGVVSVAKLSEEMDVTMVTVRKDLNILEQKGLLHRSHGSAAHVSTYANGSPPAEGKPACQEEKMKIAALAAQKIQENESIIIGSGSTTGALVRALPKNIRLTVLTAAVNVSKALINYNNIEIVQLGGVVNKGSSSVVGHYSESMLADFSCNTFFLGVKGISLEFGLTAANITEAHLDARMVRAVQKTIVLADSSKFGKKGFGKICDIGDVDMVITDGGISDECRARLEERGLEVMIAK